MKYLDNVRFLPTEPIPDQSEMPYTLDDFYQECEQLWIGVAHEFLNGDEFAKRTHGSQATYQDGCTGPACVAAHRIQTRKSRGGQPSDYWKVFEPVLMHFVGIMDRVRDEALSRFRTELSSLVFMEYVTEIDAQRGLQELPRAL